MKTKVEISGGGYADDEEQTIWVCICNDSMHMEVKVDASKAEALRAAFNAAITHALREVSRDRLEREPSPITTIISE